MRRWLVGVDGGERSLAALVWATRAIGPDGHLHVVHVRTSSNDHDDRALAMVDASMAPDGVVIDTSDVVGDVAGQLRERATQFGADAIVIGTHARHLRRRRRMGPTIRELLAEQTVTVIVVPEGAVATVSDDRPVVVGAGHGVATDAAVGWASEFAVEHGMTLLLVRAIGVAPGLSLGNLANDLAYYLRPSQRVTWAVEDLHELGERARRSGRPGLDVASAAVRTTPARVLAQASRHAALVVVGLHRSDVTGRDRPDWTLRHVLGRARSPVAVVPAGRNS